MQLLHGGEGDKINKSLLLVELRLVIFIVVAVRFSRTDDDCNYQFITISVLHGRSLAADNCHHESVRLKAKCVFLK